MFRKFLVLIALAAPLAITPAVAQQQKPVSSESKAGKRALLDENTVTVRNVSREEIVNGLPLLDDDGESVGTIQRLAGNDVIISDGSREYRVPFTQIYAFSKDGADRYATRLPKSKMKRARRAK